MKAVHSVQVAAQPIRHGLGSFQRFQAQCEMCLDRRVRVQTRQCGSGQEVTGSLCGMGRSSGKHVYKKFMWFNMYL
jgi:hypothetical protein